MVMSERGSKRLFLANNEDRFPFLHVGAAMLCASNIMVVCEPIAWNDCGGEG